MSLIGEGILLLTLGFIGSANAISSPEDLFTTTCKEQSLEGLQRVDDNWESAERPLRTYLIQKVEGCNYLDDGMSINGYKYKTACYLIEDNESKYSRKELMCTEQWSLESNELFRTTCQVGLSNFVFSPNDWFHKSNFHSKINRWGAINNLDTYRQDMLTVSVGHCSL